MSEREPAPDPLTAPGPRLVRDRRDEPAPPRRGRRPLLIALAALLLVAGGAAVAWRLAAGGAATGTPLQPWATIAALDLAAPLGGPAAGDGPWVRLRLDPAAVGANRVSGGSGGRPGTPTAADGSGATVAGVTFQPLTGDGAPVAVAMAGDGPVPVELAAGGWWRATVAAQGSDGAAATVPFYFLLPDPNVNGPEAVANAPTDDGARELFERGLAAHTGLHRLRYWETIGDGTGHLAIAEFAVNDGADGHPPASAIRVPGGAASVVVGPQRWSRRSPEAEWLVDNSGAIIPPSEWGETYTGATGFQLGPLETVDGERCRVVTFVVPAETEPRQREVAWYAWWVGEETGRLHREAMVSRRHYMLNEFRDFDAPLAIAPPVPPAATPAA